MRWHIVRRGSTYKVREAEIIGFEMTSFLNTLFQNYISENGGNPKTLVIALKPLRRGPHAFVRHTHKALPRSRLDHDRIRFYQSGAVNHDPSATTPPARKVCSRS